MRIYTKLKYNSECTHLFRDAGLIVPLRKDHRVRPRIERLEIKDSTGKFVFAMIENFLVLDTLRFEKHFNKLDWYIKYLEYLSIAHGAKKHQKNITYFLNILGPMPDVLCLWEIHLAQPIKCIFAIDVLQINYSDWCVHNL